MTPFLFVLVSLAVYATSCTISLESGPFNALSLFRAWVKGKLGDNHWLSLGVSCPVCVSFWVALFVAFIMSDGNATDTILHWLAIHGANRITIHYFG